MPWVAYSDDCSGHPKIAGLRDREFRVWFRANEYCQKYRTNGVLRTSALTEIKDLTAKIAERLSIELWHTPDAMCPECTKYYADKANGDTAYVVHEFWQYNPDRHRDADRKRKWRADQEGTEG